VDSLSELKGLGLSLPSPVYLFGLVLFGVIGLWAFYYGRRRKQQATKWIGVALMLYPYAVYNTWALYGVGIALCGALYYYRG
jgi:hypothetical protein